MLASTAVDVNVDQGRRWTNSLLSSYMFVVVIIMKMIIMIITFLFTEDNILSTYKHLSKIWSSFQTNAKQCATNYDTETFSVWTT